MLKVTYEDGTKEEFENAETYEFEDAGFISLSDNEENNIVLLSSDCIKRIE